MTKRILYVDSNVNGRKVANLVLGYMGYRVHTASDGISAWGILFESNFYIDLVISDYEMPGFDGITLLKRIRAHERIAQIPFVLLSEKNILNEKKQLTTLCSKLFVQVINKNMFSFRRDVPRLLKNDY